MILVLVCRWPTEHKLSLPHQKQLEFPWNLKEKKKIASNFDLSNSQLPNSSNDEKMKKCCRVRNCTRYLLHNDMTDRLYIMPYYTILHYKYTIQAVFKTFAFQLIVWLGRTYAEVARMKGLGSEWRWRWRWRQHKVYTPHPIHAGAVTFFFLDYLG